MLLVAIGWLYVTAMVALAQASSRNGSLLLAFLTFVGAGLLPVGIIAYLMLSPARRRARRAAESATPPAGSEPVDPDQGGLPAGGPVAPVREEP